MQIDVIEPHQVKAIWPYIRHHIDAAQRRGPTDMTADEIRGYCQSDESWRLLVLEETEAAAVIRIIDDRLHVVSLGGKLRKGWPPEFFDWLASAAKYLELPVITLGGRKGWNRVLKPLGFVPIGNGYLGAQIK